jgi:hypothetical protein
LFGFQGSSSEKRADRIQSPALRIRQEKARFQGVGVEDVKRYGMDTLSDAKLSDLIGNAQRGGMCDNTHTLEVNHLWSTQRLRVTVAPATQNAY